MAKRSRKGSKKNDSGANLGFEQKLWAAADKMRGHMGPAEYERVAFGLQVRLEGRTGRLQNDPVRRDFGTPKRQG